MGVDFQFCTRKEPTMKVLVVKVTVEFGDVFIWKPIEFETYEEAIAHVNQEADNRVSSSRSILKKELDVDENYNSDDRVFEVSVGDFKNGEWIQWKIFECE